MDSITPNRLRVGRNNDLSPAATIEVTGNTERILNSLFKAWLISHAPRLMNHPK